LLVGSCGDAKAAPSAVSVAVTRSAENGRAMGAPACRGPEVDAGGSVVVLLVDDECAAVVVVVDPACGDGLELHDVRKSAPAAKSATSARGARGGARRARGAYGRQSRFPRIGPVWRAVSGGTVHPW
jgi:hypothetical protein